MKQTLNQQPSMNPILMKTTGLDLQQLLQPIQCRICLLDQFQANNKMINPCACKGSIKYAHFKCLQAWILKLQSNFKGNKVNTVSCQLCKCEISYHKKKRRVCCSEEECLININKDRVKFMSLTVSAIFLTITFIVESYFLSQKVPNVDQENDFIEAIVITLILALNICFLVAAVAFTIGTFLQKIVKEITEVEEYKNEISQFYHTFDNLKQSNQFQFTFI